MRVSSRVRGKLCVGALSVALALVPTRVASAQQVVNAPERAGQESRPPSVKVPLSFIENHGQTDARVKFYLPGRHGTVFFTADEVVFKLAQPAKPNTHDKNRIEQFVAPQQGVVIRMSFPGANPQVRLEGIEPLPGRVNEIRGNDPKDWRKEIRTFGGVVYRDLYPGIDLEYRTDSGELQRKLIVRDRTALSAFQLRYAGTDELHLGNKGALELVTALGTLHELPIAAEEPGSLPAGTALKYAVLSKDTVGLSR